LETLDVLDVRCLGRTQLNTISPRRFENVYVFLNFVRMESLEELLIKPDFFVEASSFEGDLLEGDVLKQASWCQLKK
jgi:hypothetical protein